MMRRRRWSVVLVTLLLLIAWGDALAASPQAGQPEKEASHMWYLDSNTFPIGLWWPPPPQETTLERYKELKDAGFTFMIGGNGLINMPINERVLEAATANGLKVIVSDSRYTHRDMANVDPDQLRRDLAEAYETYRTHPSFGGFHLFDEPNAEQFAQLRTLRDAFDEVAPGVLTYINLFPSHASPGALGTADYDEHVRRFVDEVQPHVLSFDHYPLLLGGELTSDYFYNWAVIREHALRAGLPSGVFIQSVDYVAHRLPNEPEIMWQANVSLAYGAKGIMYFTYWTPVGSNERFGTALISGEGERTPLYGIAQRFNRVLQAIGSQLMPLVSETVSVAALRPDLRPAGAEGFAPDEWVADVTGSPLVLSRFKEEAADGSRWLLVVNFTFEAEADSRITWGTGVRTVHRFDPATREYVLETPGDGQTSVSLPPGAAALYRLDAE